MLSSLNLGISETISLMKRQQRQRQLVEVMISLKALLLLVVADL
jgi:hypothetical protein